jgi:hypothetical protein
MVSFAQEETDMRTIALHVAAFAAAINLTIVLVGLGGLCHGDVSDALLVVTFGFLAAGAWSGVAYCRSARP